MSLVREVPALVANLDLADGTHLRAGPEERDILERAKQIVFETEVPGGFGAGTIVLPRPDWWDPFDTAMLSSATIEDQGGRIAYKGRVVTMPKTGVNEIVMETEGWIKNAEDDRANMIFINRNAGDWTGVIAARKNALYSGGVTQSNDMNFQEDPSGGLPGLWGQNSPPTTGQARFGAMFDAGAACGIGQAYVGWIEVNGITAGDTNWSTGVRLGTDAAITSPEPSLLTGGPPALGSFTANALGKGRRYAHAEWRYDVANTNVTQEAKFFFMTIVGDHGIPMRGTIADQRAGFTSYDIATYALQRWCPLIVIGPDSIEQTSFVIPHADFRDPQGTVKNMLDGAAAWGGSSNYPLDYGCYETFFMKTPGTYGNVWRMRKDQGADPRDQGADGQKRFNQAIVTYSKAGSEAGNLTAGPLGTGCDYETDQLRITDPDHVWNRIGQPKPAMIDCGITTQEGAVLMGMLKLAEANRDVWRGTIDAKGWQYDAAGTEWPPYMIRAGERGVVEDEQDTRERRIIHTKYDDKKRSCAVDVGQPPDRFDTMMARAGVAIRSLGVGG